MKKVTKISWRIQTGNQWWSGTDTEVDMEIYRDGTLIQRLRLEPGRTTRLNRNENATYFWVFENKSGIGVSYSGFTPPYYEEFPAGIAGHLVVKFIARGDDAWEKVAIHSTVFSGEMRHVPGTIDSFYWEEQRDEFAFNQDVVLSTDSNEGHSTWRLNY
jgi:predicted secreted protein